MKKLENEENCAKENCAKELRTCREVEGKHPGQFWRFRVQLKALLRRPVPSCFCQLGMQPSILVCNSESGLLIY